MLRGSLQTPTVFHDTTHAGQRRAERSLSEAEMKDVICHHAYHRQHRRGEHGGFVYEFRKTVGGQTLTVIAEVKKHECWFITGWSDE